MAALRPNPAPDRWLLQVRGTAQVMVEDHEGRYIGPSRNPDYPYLVENHIPGASYKPGQVFGSVFLDRPGVYSFTFVAQFPTSVHISLGLFNAAGRFHTFFYQNVPMTRQSQARLVYDTDDQSAPPVLELDREGNGNAERIQPTILSPRASNDYVPPRTHLELDGEVVTASATDNPGGAGVLHTYYTTDGTNRIVYGEPFSVPPDAKIVMAYSEDRAGNLEYPGAVRPVLGLSETHMVLRARVGSRETVRHDVEVVNLDPISVTGPLEWEASADVPWLWVEPSAGRTPYSITVSMRSADLPVGRHEGKVIVRSTTPETVFPERTLHVQGEIVAVREDD